MPTTHQCNNTTQTVIHWLTMYTLNNSDILDTVLEPIKFNFDLNVMHNSKTKRVISTIHLVYVVYRHHDAYHDHHMMVHKHVWHVSCKHSICRVLASFIINQQQVYLTVATFTSILHQSTMLIDCHTHIVYHTIAYHAISQY